MESQFYPNELTEPIILSDEYDPNVGLDNKYYVLSTDCNDDGREEFEVHKFSSLEEATRYAQYNICTWCGKPAEQFRDQLSIKEYTISGFCQSCQDLAFGTDKQSDIEDDPINV